MLLELYEDGVCAESYNPVGAGSVTKRLIHVKMGRHATWSFAHLSLTSNGRDANMELVDPGTGSSLFQRHLSMVRSLKVRLGTACCNSLPLNARPWPN